MAGSWRVLAATGSILGHALFFLVVGPPIGTLAVFPILFADAIARQGLPGLAGLVSLFFFVAVLSYVVAALPAFAAGAVVAILRLAGIRRIRTAGTIVGALAAAAALSASLSDGGDELRLFQNEKALGFILAFAILPGAVAGFVATSLLLMRPTRLLVPARGARDDAVASLVMLGHDRRAAGEAVDAAIRDGKGTAPAADLVTRAARRLPPLQPDRTSS